MKFEFFAGGIIYRTKNRPKAEALEILKISTN